MTQNTPKEISVNELKEVLKEEHNGNQTDFINVCTPAEYREAHIPGVRNVPLSDIESHREEFAQKERVYVHCRSGNRARQAIERLRAAGVTAELINVTGGLTAWQEAGLPTNEARGGIPLMRQVQIAAGTLVLLGHALFFVVGPLGLALSAFVGAGLLFAGLTGWCGMAMLLARLPWNRA